MPTIPAELTAVLSALFGTLIGGFINYASTRGVKSHEWQLTLLRDRIAARQKLYAELLVEAQRLVINSRESAVSSLSDLSVLSQKFAEISLVAPEDVVRAANQLADAAITANVHPPVKEVTSFYSLKQQYIVAARKDIEQLEAQA